MPVSVSYRPTFFNPLKLVTAGGAFSAARDYHRLGKLAREHEAHARHAAAMGDRVGQAYHEQRAKHLSSSSGRASTILAARTGVGIGKHAMDSFGTGIKAGWSPVRSVGVYSKKVNIPKMRIPKFGKSGGGGGGGGVHRDSHGRFS